ncbi:MAG: FadR family transcriptional regulator [Roseicyclus sp.]|nr:FadR family transcriptional regulator [Roseicyclus sp.]MBO6626207.1 FadR family transcriptional regulator [Roseicyclus sp.]MBO6922318.1 FadR family transcriptional regulator [Roseicyclus sp.]
MTSDGDFSDNTTRALNQIRRMIEKGNLPSDGRLPTERELSEKLGCGRRQVRRALEVLEAEGLLWRRQGKGTFAGQPRRPATEMAATIADKVDTLAIMEARMGVEPQLAALCARRATAEDVDRLRLLAERAHGASDSDYWELWDGALHRLIARIPDNPILSAAFDLLDTVRMDENWQHDRHLARTLKTKVVYHEQHQRIIDAIDARDADAARSAMTDHLQTLTDDLRRSMRETGEVHSFATEARITDKTSKRRLKK